ncbi:MAG TPA: hypothetical protein DEV81_08340, partial [Cyanobacteria bacterium UBA11049]|nr:hypothetical protein [Cyanobacteria bacterium UBA11049]
ALIQQSPQPIASPAGTANTQPNVVTQPNIQSLSTSYAATNAAEAYYQQLIAQYGENYQQCLEQVDRSVEELAASDADKQEQPTSKQNNVLIALDASGSMVGKINDETKLDVAKSAIARFVTELPKTTQVGLTVFGHQGSNKEADKAISCAGIDAIYPLAQLNDLQFAQAVDSFQATGFTPMAATLERLNQNLSTYDSSTNQNVVYLISDGTENCDGDPVAAARQLHASNAKVIVNVIGLNVNRADGRQLKAVAAAGGGEYFSAANAVELNEVLLRAKNSSELNQPSTVNLDNQTQEVASLPVNISRLFACITLKMNREFGQIISQTTRLAALTESNSQYNDYALTRLKARQDGITAWRNSLQTKLSDRNNVSVDKLKQELAVVIDSEVASQPEVKNQPQVGTNN